MTFFIPREILRSLLHRRGSPEAATAPTDSVSGDGSADKMSPMHAFVEAIRTDTPDWPSHVRLINLEVLRERTGPMWPRLQPKIELLAERLIEDEMTPQDRYLNLGGGQFLVFYRHAYLEEIRIRCLAIVERIREKLFGLDNQFDVDQQGIAHVHAPGENFVTFSNAGAKYEQPKVASLWELFGREAENHALADIVTSASVTMDALVAEAESDGTPARIEALNGRLERLARNLSVVSRCRSSQSTSATTHPVNGAVEDSTGKLESSIRDAIDHAARLCEATSKGKSSTEILEALVRLRRARLERMLLEGGEEIVLPAAGPAEPTMPDTFEYHPVFRCAVQGAKIYEGIFCINHRETRFDATNDDPSAMDLALLMEALRVCARSTSAILMVPVHANTLRRPTWQRRYSTLMRGAESHVKQQIVAEVVDYYGSENSIALRRAIEELRANFLGVFVVLQPEYLGSLQEVASHCKESGVHALGVDFSRFNASEAAIGRSFCHIENVCKRGGLSSYVRGIRKPALLPKALAVGLDYICAPGLRPPLAAPGVPRYASLAELCGI